MALSEENSKYLRWPWIRLNRSGKPWDINGGEMPIWRAGKVINFPLTMPYFRFLAYLDGNGQLAMPDRRRRDFSVIQIAMLAPFIAFGAHVSGEVLLLELLGYFVMIYGVYALIARR